MIKKNPPYTEGNLKNVNSFKESIINKPVQCLRKLQTYQRDYVMLIFAVLMYSLIIASL